MFKFLDRVRKDMRAAEYRKAYDFAAGHLLRGGPFMISALQKEVEEMKRKEKSPLTCLGIEAAIADWNEK